MNVEEYTGSADGKVIVNDGTVYINMRMFERRQFAIDEISALIFNESSAIFNGNIVIYLKGSAITHEIKFSNDEQDDYRALYNFLCEKTGLGEGPSWLDEERDNPNIFVFKSMKAKVELDGMFMRITRAGALSIMLRGLEGTKSIFIPKITAIQLKEPGVLEGYLQFTLKGGNESTGGMLDAISDENTIIFSQDELEKARTIKRYIEHILTGENSPTSQAPQAAPVQSVADEILKLKALLDSGILTQEEFDHKKRKLLGM